MNERNTYSKTSFDKHITETPIENSEVEGKCCYL